MPNEHAQLIRAAAKTTRELKTLSNRLGNNAHPRGAVYTAYIRARRELRGNLQDRGVTNQVIANLRREVLGATSTAFVNANELGAEQADKNFEIFGVNGRIITASTQAANAQIASLFNTQATAVLSGQFSEGQILGDAGRVGMLTPSLITRAAVDYMTRLSVITYAGSVSAPILGLPPGDTLETIPATTGYVKQLVAAVDERTTQTCLLAAGQVQQIGDDFVLVGTPRYADAMPNPPFHDWCRSVITIVPGSMAEDALTEEMRQAAAIELELRKTGESVAPTYANALTRVRS